MLLVDTATLPEKAPGSVRTASLIAAHAPKRYRGPPMTLSDMRAQGVRSLCVVSEQKRSFGT
jgi:hypothetical protein